MLNNSIKSDNYKLCKIKKKSGRASRLCKLKSDKHDQTKALISEYLAHHPLAREVKTVLPLYRFDEVLAYTKLDPQDADLFKDLRLTFLISGKKPYARVWCGNRYQLLSRIITGAPSHLVVDHINGDTLDNRRCNLCVCTQEDNLQNQPEIRIRRWKKKPVEAA